MVGCRYKEEMYHGRFGDSSKDTWCNMGSVITCVHSYWSFYLRCMFDLNGIMQKQTHNCHNSVSSSINRHHQTRRTELSIPLKPRP